MMPTSHNTAVQDRRPDGAMSAETITIATYNIHRCIGQDGHHAPDRIERVLREFNADVVALQEVESTEPYPRCVQPLLTADAGLELVTGPTLQSHESYYGNIVISRLPVVAVRRINLSYHNREPRGALDITLDWHNTLIRVIATHFGLTPAERRSQARQLLMLLQERPRDVTVLMGDLNEWFLWGRPLRWLHNALHQTPHIRTFPARLPVFALDRIWVKPAHMVQQMETHDTPLARLASDHLPLKAILRHPRHHQPPTDGG